MRVPILGKIAAGTPIQVDPREPSNTEEWIDLAAGLLGANERLFALRVQGNSMIDASVFDGDIVILRPQDTANDGDMVAAWIEGDEETTLKYLFREGRNVRLQPANPNPDYLPIIRPADGCASTARSFRDSGASLRKLSSQQQGRIKKQTKKAAGAEAVPAARYSFTNRVMRSALWPQRH